MTKKRKRATRAEQCEGARREAEARGYAVDSVTWSEEMGAPVVHCLGRVRTVGVEVVAE